MADIFVSYASEDLDRVRPLVEAFEAVGFSVWWDRQIDPGTTWDEVLEHALSDAKWVVTVWTEHSIASRWVRTESMDALEREILVPVLLDDVIPPVAFRTTQAADLRNWRPGGTDARFDQLMARLTDGRRVVPTTVRPATSPRARVSLGMVVGALGVLAVVGTALFLSFGPAKDDEAGPPQFTTFTGQPNIAVLPFEHGDDTDDRLFADGLADEIIKGLQQYRSFPVMSRHASFTFRNSELGISEIAARLGAQYLVTGSVQRRGERLRVAAALATADGRQVWSETFEVDFVPDQVFALQDEIAQQIAGITYPQMLVSEVDRVSGQKAENLEAWGYLLKAIEITYSLDMDQADEGLAYAEKALALDPNLALAYWVRGEVGIYLYVDAGLVGAEAEEREQQIIADLREALEISPFDGAVCGCLGFVHLMRGEIDAARAVLDGALRVNPSNALLRVNQAEYLLYTGQLEEARLEAELGIRLDPISRFGSLGWSTLGLIEAVEGNMEQAIHLTRRALQLEPEETWSQAQLPLLLYLHGQTPAAEDALGNLMRDHPRFNPRNKFIYGWMVPLQEPLRLRVTEATGADQADASIADLLEWVYLELGWES
jgi:TolB-like protein/Flp pilus assembly protein TadD